MRVAAVLDEEQEVVAVPDRAAGRRVRRTVSIERRGQDPRLAARLVEHPHLRVPGRRPFVAHVERDRRSVGTERRPGVRRSCLGEAAGFGAAVGVHDEEVDGVIEIPCVVTAGRERQLAAVRRPGEAAVLELAGRDAPRLDVVCVDVDDEQVRGAIDDPADAVDSRDEPRDAAGRLVLLLVLAVPLLDSVAAEEGHPPTVGRPLQVADLVLPGQQRARLSPGGGDHADLRLLGVLLVTHERERPPVG